MCRLLVVPSVFALCFGLGVVAFASEQSSTSTSVPQEQWRPITEIVEQFKGMGYQVRGIESDDNLYEVEAIDPNGLWVKTYVNPVSGEILKERGDDDNERDDDD